MLTLPTPNQATDLAGRLHLHPHYIQTRTRINILVERFLALGILHARLRDLPAQFNFNRQKSRPVRLRRGRDEWRAGYRSS